MEDAGAAPEIRQILADPEAGHIELAVTVREEAVTVQEEAGAGQG